MTRLEGKVALITGSSRGIGAGIASLFAAEGAKVALNGRDAAALAGVQAVIEAAGGVARSFVADVRSFDEIERMRNRTEEQLGPIDVLVVNAGGSPVPPALLEEMSEEAWASVVDANLTSTFLTIKSILPGMKQRGSGRLKPPRAL